jgi:hypothetical protein
VRIKNQQFYMSKFTSQAKIIVLALALALGISYVSAAGTWTGPTATPPAGNVDTPINVGNNAQSKAGDLSVGAFLANLNSLFLGNVTIGSTLAPATFTLKNGSQGADKVLTSDANGLASWQNASGGSGVYGYEVSCAAGDPSNSETDIKIVCYRLNKSTGALTARVGHAGSGTITYSPWETASTVPITVSGSSPFSLGVNNIPYNGGSGEIAAVICIANSAGTSFCKSTFDGRSGGYVSWTSNPF